MAKLVFFSLIAVFLIGVTPVRADINHDRGGNTVEHVVGDTNPCDGGGNVPDFCNVGTIKGNSKPSSKLSTTEWVMISVGVGLAVTAVVAYFWHKKPSENNPGQISLMSF